jgi:uncharacterized membrane protein YqjE
MESKTQNSGSGRPGGLFESLKTLASTLLAIAQTRLELFSTEVEEQGIWLGSILVWVLVAAFCTCVGIVLATLLVVMALWSTNPLLALGVPTLLYLLGAGIAWIIVRGKVKERPRLFAASIAELSKDHKELISRQ